MDRLCYVRSDYAQQWKRPTPGAPGRWDYGWARVGKRHPERCALTPAVIEAHLRGRITVGTYLIDGRNCCTMLVLDHDDRRLLPAIDREMGQQVMPEDGLLLLQDCRERFREQGIASALAESRRGGHLFVFFAEPVDARDARALAFIGLGLDEAERMHQGQLAFEIYPKQDQRGTRDGAVGANIALPLGVNLKDGGRYPFVDQLGRAVASTLWGQINYLETIERVPVRRVLELRPWLYDELDRAMHPQRVRSPDHLHSHVARSLDQERGGRRIQGGLNRHQGETRHDHSGMIARWKASVDCREVVRAYGVILNENGSGCCPFHDDEHASFQAWREGWRCFAEGRGGDALDFVMEQERLSPREALAYVRNRWPAPGLERDGIEDEPPGRA